MKVTLFIEMANFMYEAEAHRAAYPEDMANYLESIYKNAGHQTKLVVQKENEDGSELLKYLDDTDVLIWWAHCFHNNVSDEVSAKVKERVLSGMGVNFLHSAHLAKPFLALTGGDGMLTWREAEEKEKIWMIEPAHPIAQGLPEYFDIEHEEMYGEPFGIPAPDELVMMGWFKGGEVMRAGCIFNRGAGKVFYFQPGHETHPTYRMPEIQKILLNAAEYIKPRAWQQRGCVHRQDLIEK